MMCRLKSLQKEHESLHESLQKEHDKFVCAKEIKINNILYRFCYFNGSTELNMKIYINEFHKFI